MEENHEIFLHFDNNYILHTSYEKFSEDLSFNNNKHINSLVVYKLNGEKIQTIKLSSAYKSCKSIFSQSGEYVAVPCILAPEHFPEKDAYNSGDSDTSHDPRIKEQATRIIYLYKIKKSEDYIKQSESEDSQGFQKKGPQKPREIISIETVR